MTGGGPAPDRLVLDPALVRRLVADQFPQWADLPVTSVDLDGWDNRTFRLGDRLSVRLPSHGRYAAQVAKEQRWLPVLAPQLPLPIPAPVAKGVASTGFAHPWSVYAWLEGEPVETAILTDDQLVALASALAAFLNRLMRIDPADGPRPGAHNFFRGGPLSTYDDETRQALSTLAGEVPVDRARAVWDAALAATWRSPPVWFHGDVAAGNLLVRDGRLCAVIDFGSSGVGDPACDTTIAWTRFSGRARSTFRAVLEVDRSAWARGRGWTLWKALITIAGTRESDPDLAARARRVLHEVIADHEQLG